MSTTDYNVYIPEIFKDVCAKASIETGLNINYVFGTSVDIVKNIKSKDSSVTKKSTKYPLVALYMPIREKKGNGYDSEVLIRKIIIAHLTGKDDLPEQRYEKVMKTILYPVYNSIIKFLVRDTRTISTSPINFKHDKYDFFQTDPIYETNDYVDTVQINNLEFKITQIKKC